MKQLILLVLILSILTAVCGCSHDIDADPQQEKSAGGVEYSDNSTQGKEQEAENEQQGENETDPQEEQGENEEEPPEETPPEEPPVVEPPTVTTENALLIINELKTEFSGTSKQAEYIEFKAITAGNLNGISVHTMFDVNKPFVYYFPEINVKEGEYITLHLRTIEDNCIDELGDDLNLSGGNDSCSTARDLWVTGSEKYLHKTDIVYLQNASGGIIDAIVMNENPSMTWKKSRAHFADIVKYLCSVGAWECEDDNPTAFDAVNTSTVGQSMYKSVSRYEWRANHFNTSDWYITDNKNTYITPGLPNN